MKGLKRIKSASLLNQPYIERYIFSKDYHHLQNTKEDGEEWYNSGLIGLTFALFLV